MGRMRGEETAGELDRDTTLLLLSEIERNAFRSQRSFSSRVGMAVGLTNAYIKRCMKKGWVKMSRAPARRYAYYLTPTGFAEKSRLTGEYLATSFHFFREARAQCLEALHQCEQQNLLRVALHGRGELAEIAALASSESGVRLVGVVEPGAAPGEFAGLPLAARLEGLPAFDAVIVTDIRNPQAVFDDLREKMPEHMIWTPPLLHVSRKGRAKEKAAG